MKIAEFTHYTLAHEGDAEIVINFNIAIAPEDRNVLAPSMGDIEIESVEIEGSPATTEETEWLLGLGAKTTAPHTRTLEWFIAENHCF